MKAVPAPAGTADDGEPPDPGEAVAEHPGTEDAEAGEPEAEAGEPEAEGTRRPWALRPRNRDSAR